MKGRIKLSQAIRVTALSRHLDQPPRKLPVGKCFDDPVQPWVGNFRYPSTLEFLEPGWLILGKTDRGL